MDALRKAYQRAVCIPLNNVEAVWQEYNQFENNLNKMTVSFPSLPWHSYSWQYALVSGTDAVEFRCPVPLVARPTPPFALRGPCTDLSCPDNLSLSLPCVLVHAFRMIALPVRRPRSSSPSSLHRT